MTAHARAQRQLLEVDVSFRQTREWRDVLVPARSNVSLKPFAIEGIESSMCERKWDALAKYGAKRERVEDRSGR